MRVTASIKLGTVTASLTLRKRAAYPRQNSLAMGLREFGRLERTLFTFKWLGDPALRRRGTGRLNKGEARNALARTAFFHRLGEIRDRSYENQRYRAHGRAAVDALAPSYVIEKCHTNERLPASIFRAARGLSSRAATPGFGVHHVPDGRPVRRGRFHS